MRVTAANCIALRERRSDSTDRRRCCWFVRRSARCCTTGVAARRFLCHQNCPTSVSMTARFPSFSRSRLKVRPARFAPTPVRRSPFRTNGKPPDSTVQVLSSAPIKRYVTPWGEIRDGDSDAVLARTARVGRASFNARTTAVVVCSGQFRESTCELRRTSDGGLVRQFETGLEFQSWAPSGELLFLRSSTRGGGLYDGASGALLGPGEGVTYAAHDLAIVFLQNRSSDVWSTSPPRRLSPFEGQVGTSAYSTASDRVLLWPQNRGFALIVDVGWARRDPPDADETALVTMGL